MPIPHSPAERGQWLAALDEGLSKAQKLLEELADSGCERPIAYDLYWRIAAARMEIQSLRSSRSLQPRESIDPEWRQSSPWLSIEAFG